MNLKIKAIYTNDDFFIIETTHESIYDFVMDLDIKHNVDWIVMANGDFVNLKLVNRFCEVDDLDSQLPILTIYNRMKK